MSTAEDDAYSDAYEPSSSSSDGVRDDDDAQGTSPKVHKGIYTDGGLVRYSALKAYSGILRDNVEAIERKTATTKTLSPSTIGASYWTYKEKEIFFDKLAVHGATNLQAIAASIGNKTVPEVRQYLLALEEGLDQLNETIARRGAKFVQVPAAAELSSVCEQRLEILAEKLEQYLHDRVCDADRAEYGGRWIIDEARAHAIEEERSARLAAGDDEEGSDKVDRQDHSDMTILDSSMDLLKPSNFIRLSRNVFMNGNVDQTTRYDRLPVTSEDSSGPSMLRSSFEMMHDLCVKYTKRLVHAAHFQAMARLRADPDLRRNEHVLADDVHKAFEIMKIKRPDRVKYWADATERYALDVYAYSKRLRHGDRHHRNIGYKLKREAIREALSQAIADTGDTREESASNISDFVDDESRSEPGEGEHEFMDHLDEAINTEDDSADIDQPSSDSQADSESSPDELEVEREEYLESCDQKHSHAEDNALRELLSLPIVDTDVTMLSKPRGDLQNDDYYRAWRNFNAYVSDWEQPDGRPSDDRFHARKHARLERKRRHS